MVSRVAPPFDFIAAIQKDVLRHRKSRQSLPKPHYLPTAIISTVEGLRFDDQKVYVRVLISGAGMDALTRPLSRSSTILDEHSTWRGAKIAQEMRKRVGLLEQALRRLQQEHPLVDRLLERLPQGLNTSVGEGGKRLSGGQRQIVTILRALLRDADVVIFDKATAHLDDEIRHLVRDCV